MNADDEQINPTEDDPGVPPRPPVPTPPPVAAPLAPPLSGPSNERQPWLAAGLSIVPCLGHLYAGATGRAVGLFVAWVTALTLLPFGLNIAAGVFLWFFGIFDAFRCTQLANLGDDAPDRDRQPVAGSPRLGAVVRMAARMVACADRRGGPLPHRGLARRTAAVGRTRRRRRGRAVI